MAGQALAVLLLVVSLQASTGHVTGAQQLPERSGFRLRQLLADHKLRAARSGVVQGDAMQMDQVQAEEAHVQAHSSLGGAWSSKLRLPPAKEELKSQEPVPAVQLNESLSQAAGLFMASLPTNLILQNNELYWRMRSSVNQEPLQGSSGSSRPGGYVALCTLVRDQGPDMHEWLEHHLALGVSKIYLFDHHSSPPMYQWILPYIQRGQIVYSYLHDPGRTTYANRVQNWVYARCIEEFGSLHQFMGFIDVDEYIMFTPKSEVTELPAFLKAYENYPGLGVQWLLFGSSGHEQQPAGGVVQNYWECSQDRHVKTIANLDWKPHTATPPNPHIMAYEDRGQPDRKAVDEKFREIRGERQGALNEHFANDLIVLAHYVVKSLQDFQEKMNRGMPSKETNRRDMVFFEEMNRRAAGNDCRNFTARYLPQRT